MNQPKVIALILTYNDSRLASRCIQSVLSSNYENLLVYLLDNNSEPKYVNEIREAFPQLNIIQTANNIGYSGAFNVGIRKLYREHPDATYFWLLNNDLEVDQACLKTMIDKIHEKGDIGFAGPETFRRGADGEHDQWITLRGRPKNPGHIVMENEYKCHNAEPVEIEYAVGHCLLVRTEMAREVGLLREFFIYCEEMEWQWRAKLKGWKSCAVPRSIAYHDRHSFQKPYNLFLRTRNYLFYNRLILKNTFRFLPHFLRNLAFVLKDFVGTLRRGLYTMAHVKFFVRAMWAGLFAKIPRYPKLV